MNTKQEYCGHISIIGKVNVGKSTLLNKIVGKKISIISRKKNTTQNNITGITTKNCYQSIFIDTPGLISGETNYLNKSIKKSVLILLMIDKIYWTEQDEIIFNEIKKTNIPTIILINKIDKMKNKNLLLPFIDFLKQQKFFKEIIPISAKKTKNFFLLENIIVPYLPKNNHLYPDYYITTNSKVFTISEIIREELLLFLGDELPSIVKVTIISYEEKSIKNRKELYIRSIIWVQNKRQKKIIIGSQGEKIKKISIFSRNKIEKEFSIKTHLFLWIKYKSLSTHYKI